MADEEVSQEGDQHAGTKFPRRQCLSHPGCPYRWTCYYSHGLVHSSTGPASAGPPRTCFLGQAPHNQGCFQPTWNGEPFEFCSSDCKRKAMNTPKGPLGCRRENCPCPVTMNGVGGQFCCEACVAGTPCKKVTHLLPLKHLVVVATPQPGKYAACARANCACAVEAGSSWDGSPGQYCCRACRNGTPCTVLWHTVPEALAAEQAPTEYVSFECALDDCSRPTWNGCEGEYCCITHRRMALGNAVAWADLPGEPQVPDAQDAAGEPVFPEDLPLPPPPEPPAFPDYPALLKNAQTWAARHGGGAVKGGVTGIWWNASLDCIDCPARQKFEQAADRVGLDDWADGEFGWHGTKSMAAVEAICWNSWDPQRRSGQAYGPGEYFSRGTRSGLRYSEGYAGGDAGHLLIVAWIMSHEKGAAPKDPKRNGACSGSLFHTPDGHIVCNSPVKTGEMYCLPVAVVSFGEGGRKPKLRVDAGGNLRAYPSGDVITKPPKSVACSVL